MVLHNVYGFEDNNSKHIHIENGQIKAIETDSKLLPEHTIPIYFDNAMAFPGLINSHDHLDFNLFNQTGNHVYNNYTEWGADIHANNTKEIDAVLKVPKELRVLWGLYKNLIAGVTTVVEHGKKLKVNDEIITVFQNVYNLHSVGFEKNWPYQLNRLFAKSIPFVIHTGEGTDVVAKKEINRLLKWNLFKRRLIAVHGVAMNTAQAKGFAALVWCPSSNYFLLGSTAAVASLKMNTAIILGTDSTLTAGWNIWDHLRLARKQNALTDKELFDAVTKSPATVWQMYDKGAIASGAVADIVVAKTKDASASSFYTINPEDILLVLHKGNIRLFDVSIKDQIAGGGIAINQFSAVKMGLSTKYVWGNINVLITEIKKYYPQAQFPVSPL